MNRGWALALYINLLRVNTNEKVSELFFYHYLECLSWFVHLFWEGLFPVKEFGEELENEEVGQNEYRDGT